MNPLFRTLLPTVIILLAAGATLRADDADGADLPSLYELGLHAESDGNTAAVQVSGQLDAEYLGLPGRGPGLLRHEEHGLPNLNAHLFVDAFLGDHLYALLHLKGDRGEPADQGVLSGRVQQALVRYTPWTEHDLHLQLGKFVTPFGAWPGRHLSTNEPIFFAPLPYAFRTTICTINIPGSADGFLRWKDQAFFRRNGAPPIWDAPYPVGIEAFGSGGPVDARLAVVTSGTSSGPHEWNATPGEFPDVTWLAHLGVKLSPAFRIGMNVSTGPYLIDRVENRLPFGANLDDYRQRITGFEAEFALGHLVLRGEIFRDQWEVPNVRKELIDHSGYVEARYDLHPRWFAGARVGGITFNSIPGSNGAPVRWDYPATQWDLGLGHRLTDRITIRTGVQWNAVAKGSASDDTMWALRVSLVF